MLVVLAVVTCASYIFIYLYIIYIYIYYLNLFRIKWATQMPYQHFFGSIIFYLYCDKFAFSNGFISLCVFIFLTASSKWCGETIASEACFAASSGVGYLCKYSCNTKEIAELTIADTSAPTKPFCNLCNCFHVHVFVYRFTFCTYF